MAINQRKGGVILSYLAQLIHIITNLLYVPVMLRLLGKSEYGLYQLAISVISNLNILSLGFNSAYIRFYTRLKVKEEEKSVYRLNGMFIVIFSAISIACLLVGAFIVIKAKFILGNSLTDVELAKGKKLMAVLVVSMSVSFISSVFQSIISAHQRFIWLRVVELVSYVINPMVSIPLLILGFGSIGMVVVSLAITSMVCILNIFYSIKYLKVVFVFDKFNWSLFKEMSGYTFYVFINIIVEQINWSLDSFLLGRMRGTGAVAIYAVGSQIITLYRSLSGSIRGVYVLSLIHI